MPRFEYRARWDELRRRVQVELDLAEANSDFGPGNDGPQPEDALRKVLDIMGEIAPASEPEPDYRDIRSLSLNLAAQAGWDKYRLYMIGAQPATGKAAPRYLTRAWGGLPEDEQYAWVEAAKAIQGAGADADALDRIAVILSGNEWNADAVDLVARLVRETGRAIDDLPDEPEEPEPGEYDPGPEVDDEGGMSEHRHLIRDEER